MQMGDKEDRATWFSKESLQELTSRYIEGEIKHYELIDTTRDSVTDIRLNYVIKLMTGDKVVLKIAHNTFSTPTRISVWAALVDQYNNAGVYCPAFLRERQSDGYCSMTDVKGIDLRVWAEEFKRYQTIDEYYGNDDELRNKLRSSNKFIEQLADYLGRISTVGIDGIKTDFATAYSLYDKHCPEDEFDENYENAVLFYETLRGSPNIDCELVEEIWHEYNRRKTMFETQYRKLPKAMYQGDLSSNNVLIDDKLNFAGVIDFNLAGTETVIRYALAEGLPHEHGKLGERWIAHDYQRECDLNLQHFFECFSRFYTFSQDELDSICPLYNIVRPFTWPFISDMVNFYFKRQGDFEEVNYGLRWMYQELTRNDIRNLL